MLFVYVGVFDFRRKIKLMGQCSAMISDTEIKDSFTYEFDVPLLDMQDSRTVESWYAMRVAFLDFGRKYTYRIFLYASLVMPLCIVMIAFVILQMLNVIRVVDSSAFVSVFFLTLVSLSVIIYMIYSGICLNEMFAIHRDLLLNIMGLLMIESNYATNDSNIHNSIKVLEFEVKKLEQDELLRPIKIMGFRTDSVFFTKILAILFSGVFAMANVFLKNNPNTF